MKAPGCQRCGLIGCHCHEVEDTFTNAVCKECKSDPCECEGKPIARTHDGVCTVCRRSTINCICASHHGVKQVLDVAVRPNHLREHTRPFSDKYIEVLVNEGLALYYHRDADGLAKWLRKTLR